MPTISQLQPVVGVTKDELQRILEQERNAIALRVKEEVQKQLKESAMTFWPRLLRTLEEERNAIALRVKEEVRKQLNESAGAFARVKEEAQRLQTSLKVALERCSQEASNADRLCRQLKGQLAREQPAAEPAAEEEPTAPCDAPHTLYRNIKYSEDLQESLIAYGSPAKEGARCGRVAFGSLLTVQKELKQGTALWLQLAEGRGMDGEALNGAWVQAQLADGCVQCARLTGNEHKGRPAPEEYCGQSILRHTRTTGYAGKRDLMLLSASSQAFWPAVNLSCLLRNVGIATASEDGAFDEKAALYAVNVYRLALADQQRRMFVTTRPTANWRRYAGPSGTTVPDVEDVRADLDGAQFSECRWLCSNARRLGLEWHEVRFCTASSLLKQHLGWTCEECMQEAVSQAEEARKGFEGLSTEDMEHEFFNQLFCIEEAFALQDLQADLGVAPADRRSPTHNSQLRSEPATPHVELLTRAKGQLEEMKALWFASRGLVDAAQLQLDPALPGGNCLHELSQGGSVEVLTAMLTELSKRQQLREALCRKDVSGQTPLHRAAVAGNCEAVQLLLGCGHVRDMLAECGRDGLTPLQCAIEAREPRALSLLLRAADGVGHRPLAERCKDGSTLLHLAAAAGEEEAVRVLVDLAAAEGRLGELMLEKAADAGLTPLQLAAASGSESATQVLMDAARGTGLMHQLFVEVMMGRAQEARFLVEVATSANLLSELLVERDGDGHTALHSAAAVGSEQAVRLLTNAADSTGQLCELLTMRTSTRGHMPLQCAVSAGHAQAVRLLLDAAAYTGQIRELLAEHEGGFNLLHCAAFAGHGQAARVLLDVATTTGQARDLITGKDGSGRTPLHCMPASGYEQVVRVLLGAAASAGLARDLLLVKDAQGRTPLLCAALQGCEQAVRALLDVANATSRTREVLAERDGDGYLPLHLTARAGSMRVACVLLDAARMTKQLRELLAAEAGPHRFTPLHCAVEEGNEASVRVLLDAARAARGAGCTHDAALVGGQIRELLAAVDLEGRTVLHCAAVAGSSQVVRFLLDAAQATGGALEVLSATDSQGCLALHLAVQHGQLESVRHFLHVASSQGARRLLEVTDGRGRTPLSYSTSQAMTDLLSEYCE